MLHIEARRCERGVLSIKSLVPLLSLEVLIKMNVFLKVVDHPQLAVLVRLLDLHDPKSEQERTPSSQLLRPFIRSTDMLRLDHEVV